MADRTGHHLAAEIGYQGLHEGIDGDRVLGGLLARGTLGLGHGMRSGIADRAHVHVQADALAEVFAQHGLQAHAAFAFGQRLHGHAQHDGVALHADPFALARQFGRQAGDRQARGQLGPGSLRHVGHAGAGLALARGRRFSADRRGGGRRGR